ncbi:nucleotidyl transferase AbiEii/AbiGii toxin family protein [Algoriphagus sp. D3-2-R+10]|uniref:nucleotidyl transferase AbiEii/AbiGii toxin family protein n=1 Tax=Algoriphagus aurantiacus TaxID=3103948 RepID=UPI002B3C2EBB|nr:nucleotidyl transferase AbiEii/AbiGii toxin family protein [Algoriphagus sp. D3-2-R+10]MEB2773770.1 nucleotidyl transferase AbiEii/AbiGii toxin family protein [Algoriphagus sp. D3-2-R+10]
MIRSDSLHIDWITKVSSSNRQADKILVEKVIRAMLLEGLVKQNLDFIFKGGTALMLLLDSSKRLSIDIDIIIEHEPEDLKETFETLLQEQGFTRFELQERKTSFNIHKAHYKFFYQPIHKTQAGEESILLDILFEKVEYSKIIEVPINSKFLLSDGEPIRVKVPSIEDILGDKLTAYAPNSTGIPYYKGEISMSMEIMKQLYDIGNLVDIAEGGGLIKKTFEKFALTELEYRNQPKLTVNDVLEDIYQTSLCLVSRGADGKGDFDHLQTGIQRVSRFIFSESFHIDKAIIFASKAAYISTLMKYNHTKIEKYGNPAIMKDWAIGEPSWPRLNRLKKSNPEAFFYWYKIFELTTVKN